MGEAKLIPVYYMSIVTGWGCVFCLHTVVGEGRPTKNFLTHYLVLRSGLLCGDIAIFGLLLCLYISMWGVLYLYYYLTHDLFVNFLIPSYVYIFSLYILNRYTAIG